MVVPKTALRWIKLMDGLNQWFPRCLRWTRFVVPKTDVSCGYQDRFNVDLISSSKNRFKVDLISGS